jgi:hypothetical protein
MNNKRLSALALAAALFITHAPLVLAADRLAQWTRIVQTSARTSQIDTGEFQSAAGRGGFQEDGPIPIFIYKDAVAIDAAGNVVTVGYGHAENGFRVQLIAKHSRFGDLEWTSAFAALGINSWASANSVAIDADSNVFVTGCYDDQSGAAIVRTAKYSGVSGAVLWSVEHVATSGAQRGCGYDLKIDRSGNVFVVATDLNNGTTQMRILKYSGASGVLLWSSFHLPSQAFSSFGWSAAVGENGDVVAVGYGVSALGRRGIALIKFHGATGAPLWNFYSQTGDDNAFHAALAPDGEVYVTGASDGNLRTMRLSSATGTVLWDKRGHGGPGFGAGHAVALAPDGDPVVTGQSTDFSQSQRIRTIKYAKETGDFVWSVEGPADNAAPKDWGSKVLVDANAASVVGFAKNADGLQDGVVIRFSLSDGEVQQVLRLGASGLTEMAYAADQNLAGVIAVGGYAQVPSNAVRAMYVSRLTGSLTQTISQPIPAPKSFGSPAFPLSAGASSGLPVEYMSQSPTVCTVSEGLLSIVSAGTCEVTLSQSGSGIYAAAQSSMSIDIAKATQTIAFAALKTAVMGDAPSSLAASASSGLAVVFSSLTPLNCEIVGELVTLKAAGTCTVAVDQEGNINYMAADRVTQSFAVKSAPTILLSSPFNPAKPAEQVTLVAAIQGELISDRASVTFYIAKPDGSFQLTACTSVPAAPGTAALCNLPTLPSGSYAASFSAYYVKDGVTRYVFGNVLTQVILTPQVISYGQPPNLLLSAASLILEAHSTSGLPVAVATTTPGTCGVASARVLLLQAGLCGIRLSQAGNSAYDAADDVFLSFIILRSQTITASAIGLKTYGDPAFTISAAASSQLPLQTHSLNEAVCQIAALRVTIVGAGLCPLVLEQSGDNVFGASPPLEVSFTVKKASQQIAFLDFPRTMLGESLVPITASASSGLPVTFSSITPAICGVLGQSLILKGTGTCVVRADQFGDLNFDPSDPIQRSLEIEQPPSMTVQAAPATVHEGDLVTFRVTLSQAVPGGTAFISLISRGSPLPGCNAMLVTADVPAVCTTTTLPVGDQFIGTYSYYEKNGGMGFLLANSVTISVQPAIEIATAVLDFGAQSMGTQSQRVLSVKNASRVSLNAVNVALAGGSFAATDNCLAVPSQSACQVTVTFKPAITAGPINSASEAVGLITISVGTMPPMQLPLKGTGEKSLVPHYYASILRRPADQPGKAFWQGESVRILQLGASVREVWFAMGNQFFDSAEYRSFKPLDAEFVIDLYQAFFARDPDLIGLNYWSGQLSAGVPREVLLSSFVFSPEFSAFTTQIFGSDTVRPEIDTVVDFYRGLLSRLPDTSGFAYWLQRFRAAQCIGVEALSGEVEAISSAFVASPEYSSRARSDAQYVGDLYNAFLRRGGDANGVLFWINSLKTGAQSRESLRQEFMRSPEFQGRMRRIAEEVCLQ